MTVSLHSLIEEWKLVNAELHRAAAESHRRYPFPLNIFGESGVGHAAAPAAADRESASPSPAPTSSTATYARVYSLLSHVRHLAEDARYNSFFIVQNLLWVTIVAWANQLAIASGHVFTLPPALRRRATPPPTAPCTTRETSGHEEQHRRAAAPDQGSATTRTSFPCALLAPLEFWSPGVMGDSATAALCSPAHRSPSLPEVWSSAVDDIFAVWCTLPAGAAEPPPSAVPAMHYAYTWVVVAQHYHRFKALLSLYFLRYDALLEELEEQRQRRGCPPAQQQQSLNQSQTDAVGQSLASRDPPRVGASASTLSPRPSSVPQWRRGVLPRTLSLNGSASGVDGSARAGGAASRSPLPPPSLSARTASGSGVRGSGEYSRSGSNTSLAAASAGQREERTGAATAGEARSTRRESGPPSTTTSPSWPPPSSPFPTTARLLASAMRSVACENLEEIHDATAEALLFLLLPRVHRARLHQQQQTSAIARALQERLASPSLLEALEADAAADAEDAGEDPVVWSAPPSPLLSFSETPRASFETLTSASSASRAARRAQQSEYVLRNVFKLLLMAEDCRIHYLQRWLVEYGKQVAAVYGTQLALTSFEEAAVHAPDPSAFSGDAAASDAPAAATAATTTRTLADAIRVLRDILQAYVRLRTKLLFLNTGTTHFLGALTPWGRTRMLESLNAFLCGLCGVMLPSSVPIVGEAVRAGQPRGRRTTAASPLDGFDEAVLFTPTNAAVANFARRWAVPLWVAMCDDAHRRLEAAGTTGNGWERDAAGGRAAAAAATAEVAGSEALAGPVTPTATERRSVASADWRDAPSRASSVIWPPASPTVTHGADGGVPTGGDASIHVHSGGGEVGHAFTRTRGRGLDLKRVLLQQQQQRARKGLLQVPQRGVTARRPGAGAGGGGVGDDGMGSGAASGAGLGGSSLYTAESSSSDDGDNSDFAGVDEAGSAGGHARRSATGTATAAAEGPRQGRADVGGEAAGGAPGDAQRAARRRHRSGAAAGAARGTRGAGDGGAGAHRGAGRTASDANPATQRLSRAAQLHQVATLPDEGFPSLLYLMPRRSRFVAQDKAAAAGQQQLFTSFSTNVQAYLTSYLAEAEAAEESRQAAAATQASAAAAGTSKRRKKAVVVAAAEGDEGRAAGNATPVPQPQPPVAERVTPFPQAVLARMMFLLDMTYAALQGSSTPVSTAEGATGAALSSPASRARRQPPLMETGLTASGQERGAVLLEQESGEYESVVTTTLSAPTSPAVLTITAVRKGFQGFLAAHERRAVLTLAQALYALMRQGAERQPPAAPLDAVDTVLNMASLLNFKDMFVAFLKGYLAPLVMMARTPADLAVESQVVGRMAYRLGAAVAAPCLTLLRDLQLAMSDPRNAAPGPLLPAGVDGRWDGEPQELTAAAATGMTAVGTQLVATRDAETLAAAAGPLHHGTFGLIHNVRVLCQAWWQPHTAVLLPSRRLRQLWERHQLLDDRIVDAVLRVEWLYEGHARPFEGYGRATRGVESMLSSLSDSADVPGGYSRRGAGGNTGSSLYLTTNSLAAATQQRTATAAAVVRGFSSALGNAVRRTGRQAGDFGYHGSDNESEDYSEAYGGLLTLRSLEQHRATYPRSNSSYHGSHLSSIAGGGGGGAGALGNYGDISDGGQSTIADDRTSVTVPVPVDGQLERRRLRWPLGDGQLDFYVLSKNAPHSQRAPSHAVLISGPPLTLLVCQLLDRAGERAHSFNALHKALPTPAPKPLLAHLLHELVKASVVVRSVVVGTRQVTYALRDDVEELHTRRVVVDVRAAAQQQWELRTLTLADVDTTDDAEGGDANEDRADKSRGGTPTGTTGPAPAAAKPQPRPRLGAVPRSSDAALAGATARELSSPTYSADRTHKVKVCIVRVMKGERVLAHHDLAERVAAALEDQCVVTPGLFKRCVGHLIDKEFLQRGEQGEYMYLS